MAVVDLTERVRELEQALEESRRRQQFLIALDSATQALAEPRDIMQTAARLLSEHLDADRCAYANVEDEKVFDIIGDWPRGVPSIVGRWDVAAFGPACALHMLQGTAYVVDDTDTDPRIPPELLAAYRATTIRAVICVPLHKQGVFSAAMAVHQKVPRRWTASEVELVTTVVARCWEALERSAATRKLADSRARLEYAVRLSGVGFWYCDLPFDELLWDERVKAHFWLPADARVTIDLFYARIHPDDRERTRAAIDASIANHTSYDVIYRTVDPVGGGVKHIRALGGSAYADDGTPRRFDGVTLDVTELRENDRRKDEFLAMLAHELRNPLAPIRSGLELLQHSSDPAVMSRAVAVMSRQISHVVRMVDDLLDISRITLGKVKLVRTKLDVRAVLDSALETAKTVLDAAGHQLVVEVDDAPMPLYVDATRIIQVLANVLTNAAKYTPQGGRIRVHAERVPGSPRVRVSVEDNGIGIPPDRLTSVFEMFTQLTPAANLAQGGLGMGLTLARRLVEMHGGTIVAASEGTGRGSTFSIELPLAPPEVAGGAPVADAAATRSVRILLVDDNQDAADLLSLLLQADGHQVTVAHTGGDALRIARELAPEVVLLDLGLPDIEGTEVARRLRAEDSRPRPHLVAITGWGDESHRKRTAEVGFDEHFVKPIDRARLTELLARVR